MGKPYAPNLIAYAERLEFDEHDDDLMHDVMGNERLSKPVQALLISRLQFKVIENSFGMDTLNKAKAFDALSKELDDLYKACVEQWQDQ